MNEPINEYQRACQKAELPYWMMLAHLPRWSDLFTNKLAVAILRDNKMVLSEFFSLSPEIRQQKFGLSSKQESEIQQELRRLLEYQRLFNELDANGVKILTLASPGYSKTLKRNLKMRSTPLVLYVRGNIGLLQNPCSAIVGSRKASQPAIRFADYTAKRLSQEGRVIVSGFAKGVDQRALDSALEANGQSIIVLPQGMLTFKSGIRKYQNQIENGSVLVLSAFPPKAGWSGGLAMARNAYIYGMADSIYVAQTESSGGTWSGAVEGLKKNQTVLIYYSQEMDSLPLRTLVSMGAIPVDLYGEEITGLKESVKSTLF